ncbi:hypothetical protein NIZ92_11650 [Alcaligenes sp. 1735tsa3]|uniref:hypothetical protein n=1 Tax=Alcaligenes sp. 1735tsa3 TaxID=2953809 RepID=UPI0020A73ABA|nr:hypothetical protein [Alcaligenes sp. 1735tsa3]USY23977.1 hypothetical protein NIZ92_11650 [Alcaligenes sp. 1735tsa3]
MTALAYLMLLAGLVTAALLIDKLWVRVLHPRLAQRFNWAPLPTDSEIPTGWCLGSAGAVTVAAGLLNYIAPAAGY